MASSAAAKYARPSAKKAGLSRHAGSANLLSVASAPPSSVPRPAQRLAASGAILVVKVLYELHRTGGRYGLVTMCIGGGQGIAAVLERA